MFFNYLKCIFISILIICGICACAGEDLPKESPPPVVKVIKIKPTKIPFHKQYIGVTKSLAQIDIRARVKGFLTEANFVEGNRVKKGELLFVIDKRPFEAKVAMAQGQLEKSIAARDYAKAQYERMKVLVDKGDISKTEYDKAFADYQSAIGQVLTAQADLKDAKINLEYCSMYSPVDGIIGKKYVDVGNLVGGVEDTLLATVVQLNPIYVEFNPSVSDFNQMLPYMDNMPFPAEVTLPFNKMKFKGEVNLINNQADIKTSTILMRATIENAQNLLVPGIYVDVDMLLTKDAPRILIPSTAVTDVQGDQTVLIVEPDNKVNVRKIKVEGIYKNFYIVNEGVLENDLVIVEGIQKIPPGGIVSPTIITEKNG